MNPAQAEAIANADAHTNNAGLPTYSELVEALRKCRETEREFNQADQNCRLRGAVRQKKLDLLRGERYEAIRAADAILARVPA